MSAQIRYRTLVANIGRIYAAPSEQRTSLLQTGLDEIVTVTAPASALGWQTVGADSRRLLRVWAAKETDPAAGEVVEQLTDLLTEMAQLTVSEPPPQLVIPPSPPSLMVFEQQPQPVRAADRIALVPDMVALPAANLISLAQAAALEGSVASSISDAEEEVEEEYIEVEEEEEVAPKPAAVAAAPKPAAPSKVEEEVEEEIVEEEEEVVEEEEVEEEVEEEGLEVEPISIRGRKYWLGSDQKLYAVIDDDDVGDAVGEMVDGKPRFYAPTK